MKHSLIGFCDIVSALFFCYPLFRCLLRDKEVACREKDNEIRDLKEKIVSLSCALRQIEMQKTELLHQVKLQVSMFGNFEFCLISFFRFLGPLSL